MKIAESFWLLQAAVIGQKEVERKKVKIQRPEPHTMRTVLNWAVTGHFESISNISPFYRRNTAPRTEKRRKSERERGKIAIAASRNV